MPNLRSHFAAALTVLSYAAAAVYLIWRIGWTAGGAFIPLFLIAFSIDLVVVFRHVLRTLPLLLPMAQPRNNPDAKPTGVLIIVGDEPAIQVAVTLRSCLEIHGATSVGILATKPRPDIASRCRRYRVPLMVCDGPQAVGKSATALLAHFEAEYVAVVPGSAWPSPDLLVLNAAAFDDPRVASLVSGTGVVGNPGLIGGSGYAPAADGDSGAARHLASIGAVGPIDGPVIFRRSAINEIGGFASDSRHFVLHTALRLQAQGWRTAATTKPAAHRSAPWDEDQALRDRAERVRARLDLVEQPDVGFWADGVPTASRLGHLHGIVEAWSVIPRLIALVLPAVVAITGQLPFTFSFSSALTFGLPWFILAALSRGKAQGPRAGLWNGLRVGVRTLAADLAALDAKSDVRFAPGQLASRQVRLLFFILVTAIFGAFAQTVGFSMQELPKLAHALVVAASGVVIAAVRDGAWAQTDRQLRILPRVHVPGDGVVRGLSPFGIDLQMPLDIGEEIECPVMLPLPGREPFQRNLTSVVVKRHRQRASYYVAFDLDEEAFDEMLHFCAVTAPTMERLGIPPDSPFGQPQRTGRMRPNPKGEWTPDVQESVGPALAKARRR